MLESNCEYQLHILPNTKVSVTKDHGQSYMKFRPALVRHVLRNCLYVLKCVKDPDRSLE